jgi:6-phosphogluconolactonase
MNSRRVGLASLASMLLTTGSSWADDDGRRGDRDDGRQARAVYVQSNDSSSNSVLVFERHEDGSLSAAGAVATGGTGAGAGLGSQGSVVLSRDKHWLFAVNAGSNSVSALRVRHDGSVALVDVADSGGDMPISVTEADGLVYVLNAGTRQNISGFTFDGSSLRPIRHSTRALSSASNVGAAEVAFSPNADALVVTEKGTNLIDGYVIRLDGTPGDANSVASIGTTPFGFAFAPSGALLVSDASGGAVGAGAVTSYDLDVDAEAQLVTGPVADGRTAPCWVTVSHDGRFAFAANAHDGTISSYSVANDGSVALLAGVAAATAAGGAPIDLDSADQHLFVLDTQNHTIDAFGIGAGGSLTGAGAYGALPASAVGLAVE